VSVETVVCDHPADGVTLGDLETSARAHVRVNGRPDLVVARLTTKKAGRSGVLWGLVFGLYVMLQALSYVSTYPTQASRDIVAKTISNGGGINATMGPALNLGTVAGYTAWKCLGILSVLGAIWASSSPPGSSAGRRTPAVGNSSPPARPPGAGRPRRPWSDWASPWPPPSR
jgi:hypothetical protein